MVGRDRLFQKLQKTSFILVPQGNKKNRRLFHKLQCGLFALVVFLSACQASLPVENTYVHTPVAQQLVRAEEAVPTLSVQERKQYEPGELVDYVAQTGDTLPALAAHFHSTVKEILTANPIIPKDATTLPPGLPMQIPIYYQPLWGSSYQIIPDALFINGPAQDDFDAVAFVDSQPGWLKKYTDFAEGQTIRGGEVINYVAKNYSVSPRFLLAIIEYQTGALTQREMPLNTDYLLGFRDSVHKRLSQQLGIAANMLNEGYYGWRTGSLLSLEHIDGTLEFPDPWQNAASVALQYYYSTFLSTADYKKATQSEGWVATYISLFGNLPENIDPHIPGSLVQPELHLPFPTGESWTLTGGPHTGWGDGLPWSAIDFAPLGVRGCDYSSDWVTAVADGVIVRTGEGIAVLDLDGDGNERTGWVIFYLHLDDTEKVSTGAVLKMGDALGHPSCLGGNATGTHIHIARKYNGEWISAGGTLAFNLENWVAVDGTDAYSGKLIRFDREVIASEVSDSKSLILSELQR